jgi:hypothetical protein
LTPEDRHRAEFAGGTPIVLPDGRAWRFYEPTPVVREVRGGEDGNGFLIAWDFGSDLDAETNDSLGRGFQRILAKANRAANEADLACAVLEGAWFLLARNYKVTAEEFEDLLLDRRGRRGTKPFGLMAAHVESVAARVERLISEHAEAV